MTKDFNLPSRDVPTPKFLSDLVPLPYDPSVLLDPHTQTRWKLEENTLIRDDVGESEWEEMASYVGKSYSSVFTESYRHALDNRKS